MQREGGAPVVSERTVRACAFIRDVDHWYSVPMAKIGDEHHLGRAPACLNANKPLASKH
jgi:hypothetical protein